MPWPSEAGNLNCAFYLFIHNNIIDIEDEWCHDDDLLLIPLADGSRTLNYRFMVLVVVVVHSTNFWQNGFFSIIYCEKRCGRFSWNLQGLLIMSWTKWCTNFSGQQSFSTCWNHNSKSKPNANHIFIGDLNLSKTKWPSGITSCSTERCFLGLFHDLYFDQLVNELTHKDGKTLDLLLTC